MHLLQTAKCGQNAQVATRLALEGTRVVYDRAVAERQRGTGLSRRKTGSLAFSTPDESISRCNQPSPTLATFVSSALLQTLCVTNRRIYRHVVPNDC